MRPYRHKSWTRLLCLVAALMLPGLGVAGEAPVSLGVLPYITPVKLIQTHNPLRLRLAEATGRPVSLITAPGFKAFVQRTSQGRYDYVFTAPHLARLAQYRDHYRPLVKTGHRIAGVFVVPKDSDIRTLQDLENRRITMVGQSAVISQLAVQALREAGLEKGRNLDIQNVPNHNNALMACLLGDSDASLSGKQLFLAMGETLGDRLRVIGETDSVIGFVVLAAPHVDPEEADRVRESLLSFADTDVGRTYFQTTRMVGFQPVSEAEMASLQPFIEGFLAKGRATSPQ